MIMTFVEKERLPFWDYVKSKGLERNVFMRMSRMERETTYLAWRYGTIDYNSNKETEMTDNLLMSRADNDEDQEYWQKEKDSHDLCMRIKGEIGLLAKPSRVKTLVDETAKEVAGWDE